MSKDINEQLVLVVGESATGKSASLINLPNQERVMYLNCEAGKRLPFRNKFQSFKIIDPYQVYEALDHAKDSPDVDVVAIDTLTFLMDMYESQYVLNANDTQKAWGNFAQFFKVMMQEKIASLGKAAIILAHTKRELDEKSMSWSVQVPIKGSIGKGNGAESYFSTIVATKKVSLKDLEPYKSDLLHITEDDKLLGYKHVFQTMLTKDTIGERIRSPMGMFSRNETFMDNDAALLLQRLKDYYA